MYVAPQCVSLSDESIEGAINDNTAVHDFVSVDRNWGAAPDATPLANFQHLPKAHDSTQRIFETISAHLATQELILCASTVVDATLLAALPSSRKKQRDPKMHQSKKGNDWRLGMKVRVGVNAASGLVHTVISTARNVTDVTQAHALLQSEKKIVLADAEYQDAEKRQENQGNTVHGHMAMKQPKRKALLNTPMGACSSAMKYSRQACGPKSSIRSIFSKICFDIKNPDTAD